MTTLQRSPLAQADAARVALAGTTDASHKSELGQYFTPAATARLLAAQLRQDIPDVRLLDAGAGVGSLCAAVTQELCSRTIRPQSIRITAYEVDPHLLTQLHQTIDLCAEIAREANVAFQAQVIHQDFIAAAVEHLTHPLFLNEIPRYTTVVLNPPYRKISSSSRHRVLLERVGLKTTNLYTAFLGLCAELLEEHGELVAITPRSFCSGDYFRPFRKYFLERMTFTEFHLFESRRDMFRDDDVLQESIVFSARKQLVDREKVAITFHNGLKSESRYISHDRVIDVHSSDYIIHLARNTDDDDTSRRMSMMPMTLSELRISVSTGRVVDFRLAEHLSKELVPGSVPLIYPAHMNGSLSWPKEGKKPNAIRENQQTRPWLIPNDTYLLVRRLSAKEERRRVVAYVLERSMLPEKFIGIENHLNYFHTDGSGLENDLAYGLAAYLNSTFVDKYIRQFNGHTQINASDLRRLRYPDRDTLVWLGQEVQKSPVLQETIDALVKQTTHERGC
jgi:adenine-specific DNA-methyltransferase